MDVIGCGEDIGYLSWWENDGEQNFSRHDISNNYYGIRQLYPFDVDLDGDYDIVAPAEDIDQISWWENTGLQFTKRVVEYNYDAAFWAKAVDFGFDGDNDIIGCASSACDVSWWENDGYQNLVRHTIDNNFAGGQAVEAYDLDLDGDIDVMAAGRFNNQLAWWDNDGNYNFTKYVVQYGYDYATGIFPHDLDQDGDIDLLGTACSSNDVSWWENCTYTTSISNNKKPDNFSLESIYPNPFNSRVTISCILDRPADVSISVYNVTGQALEYIVNGFFEAGEYEFLWDASGQSSGVYLSRIVIGKKTYTGKMTLLK